MDIASAIKKTFYRIPELEGPIPVTETSHPFCAMAYSRVPLRVEEYGYVEEEFFMSGRANVYDVDEGDKLILHKEQLPYRTRILVRRPAKKTAFSGRVYVDILNATQGYDIEDLWHRNYLWCMEHGHGYVGITSKPINVLSLKNFDYERYKSLNWSDGEAVNMPVISKSATLPGTEEGLFWDMLGQLAMLLRQGGKKDCMNGCMNGWPVKYVYLTGQSQSGAYLNTFVSYFDSFNEGENGKKLFDGYFNIVGALVQRSVRQANEIGDLKLLPRKMHPSKTPYICVSSEADLYLFNLFMEGNLFAVKVKNENTEEEKCRYYEIPATPHTDILCPVLTANAEISRAGGKLPNLDKNLVEHINDVPTEFYICGLLEKLHVWAVEKQAPQEMDPMRRSADNLDLQRDVHGNALGGFRTPYVDVPIASYIASNPEDPEGICGKMHYFTRQKLEELYGSAQNYRKRFAEYTEKQVLEGWLSRADGDKMIEWSERAVEKVCCRTEKEQGEVDLRA